MMTNKVTYYTIIYLPTCTEISCILFDVYYTPQRFKLYDTAGRHNILPDGYAALKDTPVELEFLSRDHAELFIQSFLCGFIFKTPDLFPRRESGLMERLRELNNICRDEHLDSYMYEIVERSYDE